MFSRVGSVIYGLGGILAGLFLVAAVLAVGALVLGQTTAPDDARTAAAVLTAFALLSFSFGYLVRFVLRMLK